jgi:gliding motility-associated-like protein
MFNPLPTATISGSTTICQQSSTDIDINFTGTAPFSVSYSDGTDTTTVSGINSTLYSFTVNPLNTTTYSLVDLVDATSCVNDTISGLVTITVDSLPVITAGPDEELCFDVSNEVYNLQGIVSIGTSLWTVTSGPGNVSFSDATSPTSSFSTDAYGAYILNLAATNGVCSISEDVQIIFDAYPTALFSATPEICDGSEATLTFDLTGEAPYEVVYNDGVINDTVQSAVSPVVVTLSPNTTTDYTLVSVTDNNGCTIYPGVVQQVLVTPQPIANAGSDATLCFDLLNDFYTLQASQNVGSGVWTSSPAGLTFSSLTDPTATVTSSAYGTFELIWTVDTSFCSDSDTLYLTLNEIPTATIALSETEICIGSATSLSFNMTGVPPFDLIYSDGTNFFGVNGISSTDTTIIVAPVADITYSLVSVSSSNGCSSSPAGQSVSVQVDEMPMPDAGADQINCWDLTDTLWLSGSSDIGSTLWTYIGPGTAVIDDPLALNTFVQVDAYGSYSFILTSTNNTCIISDTMVAVLNEYPTAFLGSFGDTIICEGASTFVNIEFTGTPPWGLVYSDGTTDYTINDINSSPYQLDLSPLVTTEYTISAAFDINQCESNEESSFIITVYEMPMPIILTTDSMICGDQIVVEAANPNAGIGQWSSDNTVTFLPDDTELSVVASTTQYGIHTLSWIVSNNFCVDSTSIDIDYQEAIPDGSVYAGPDQLIFYQFATQMDAQLPAFAEGTWELISGIGNVNSPNDPYSSVSDLEFGVSTYLWTVTNGICPSVNDSVQITVKPIQESSGFSPNGDGINDVYVINGLENAAGNEFYVFNNWGDIVYKAINYQNDWNGDGLNGKQLPSDTYYYVLKITGVGDYSGYIIIKR